MVCVYLIIPIPTLRTNRQPLAVPRGSSQAQSTARDARATWLFLTVSIPTPTPFNKGLHGLFLSPNPSLLTTLREIQLRIAVYIPWKHLLPTHFCPILPLWNMQTPHLTQCVCVCVKHAYRRRKLHYYLNNFSFCTTRNVMYANALLTRNTNTVQLSYWY